MKLHIHLSGLFLLALLWVSCQNRASETVENKANITATTPANTKNLLADYEPLHPDGDVNAVVEIPTGTSEKWEVNKETGQVEWERINNIPRVVNYLGYLGNYGMIPRTLLSKENGGDGDPLDIIVLGPPEERGSLVKCKIIGILLLMDRGEQDDKLIAVSVNSPLYTVNDMEELDEKYTGVSEILELWFTHYKGKGKMVSKGIGNKEKAVEILQTAIKEYEDIKR